MLACCVSCCSFRCSPPITDLFVTSAELHLYEGFICRHEASLFRAGLQVVGLGKPKGVELSDAWQRSARVLLRRIFEKWTPSDKRSKESMCDSLMCYADCLGQERIHYPDGSSPTLKVRSEKWDLLQPWCPCRIPTTALACRCQSWCPKV